MGNKGKTKQGEADEMQMNQKKIIAISFKQIKILRRTKQVIFLEFRWTFYYKQSYENNWPLTHP